MTKIDMMEQSSANHTGTNIRGKTIMKEVAHLQIL